MSETNYPMIVFEGVDGSGKGTQAQLLLEALGAKGVPVTPFAFPRYQTPTGQMVAACLRGAYGNFLDWPPQLAAWPFALDRFEAHRELNEALRSSVVVCDRYVHSNVAHQGAKVNGDERRVLVKWIEALELGIRGLPRPDLVFWLDMPVERATELVGKKAARSHLGGLERDQHEANLAYQRQVAAVYAELADRPEWQTIRCSPMSQPRTPEQIHAEIMEKLEFWLPGLSGAIG